VSVEDVVVIVVVEEEEDKVEEEVLIELEEVTVERFARGDEDKGMEVEVTEEVRLALSFVSSLLIFSSCSAESKQNRNEEQGGKKRNRSKITREDKNKKHWK
jgi:hypothetical protein